MWYLYLILFLYLITPPLKKLLKYVPQWAVLAALGILLLSGSIFPFLNILWGRNLLPQMPAWSMYLFYYIWGYIMVVRKHGGSECKVSLILPAAALLVCLAMAASRLAGGYHVQMPYNYPPTVLLSVLLMELAAVNREWCRRASDSMWEALSSMSFTIYLIHPLFLNIFYKFLHVMPQDYPMALSLPVFFLATAGLSLLGAWCLRGIAVLRKYVL